MIIPRMIPTILKIFLLFSYALSSLPGDPEKCTGEYDSFDNRCCRESPPDSTESHKTSKNDCKRDSRTGECNTDNTAKFCSSKSGQCSDRCEFHTHECFTEANDDQVTDCCCNCFRFMEKDLCDWSRETDKCERDQYSPDTDCP